MERLHHSRETFRKGGETAWGTLMHAGRLRENRAWARRLLNLGKGRTSGKKNSYVESGRTEGGGE